ncbi:Heme-binding protein [Mycobacterium simulans]|uniref:Heme-binding protein n=1 Tax=Mycobacterium simulans TaxID=627089 RepID=A0A7Z7IHJ1_9MYCO|nr:hemophore [Mycobacterium simulans]SOJ52842.1 Heme-binding protein [Mycobacterium simulans]
MKPTTTTVRLGLLAALIAAALPGAGIAVPPARSASDPCAASEVARTIGSVAKQTGDYLDSHPETNQAMTAVLQQPAGQGSLGSLGSLKSYFEANPKAAGDLQSLAQPLTHLSTQCKLPVTLPQALGIAQAAQGAGSLPGLPAGIPGGTAGTQATPPAATGPLPGPTRSNHAN